MLRREQLQTGMNQLNEGLQPKDIYPLEDPFLTMGGLRKRLSAYRLMVTDFDRPQEEQNFGLPE